MTSQNKSHTAISKWREAYQAKGEVAFFSAQSQEHSVEVLQARIAELERFCGQLAMENTVLKKSLASASIEQRHHLIDQLREQMPEASVRTLCRWHGVNRRWYYQRRKQATPEERESKLREAMEQIIVSFPGYGYRRVTHALLRAGYKVNHKRVLRIMREQSWLCHTSDGRCIPPSRSISIVALPIWSQAGRLMPLISTGWPI